MRTEQFDTSLTRTQDIILSLMEISGEERQRHFDLAQKYLQEGDKLRRSREGQWSIFNEFHEDITPSDIDSWEEIEYSVQRHEDQYYLLSRDYVFCKKNNFGLYIKGKLALNPEGKLFFFKIVEEISPMNNESEWEALRNKHDEEIGFFKEEHQGTHETALFRYKGNNTGIEKVVLIEEFLGPSLFDSYETKQWTLEQSMAIAAQYMYFPYYLKNKRIIYPDLKPQNFSVQNYENGEKPEIFLIDFGAVWKISAELKYEAKSNKLYGTVEYVCPSHVKLFKEGWESGEQRQYIYGLDTTLYSAALVVLGILYKFKQDDTLKKPDIFNDLWTIAESIYNFSGFQKKSKCAIKINVIDKNNNLLTAESFEKQCEKILEQVDDLFPKKESRDLNDESPATTNADDFSERTFTPSPVPSSFKGNNASLHFTLLKKPVSSGKFLFCDPVSSSYIK